MTIAPEEPKTETPVPEGHVKLIIDGEAVIAPKGELLIRTAERLGTVIPRFCDHPLLDVCDNILGRSFCALGDGAVSPITSGIKYFRDEFLALCEKNKAAKPELVGAQA